jgi:transposase
VRRLLGLQVPAPPTAPPRRGSVIDLYEAEIRRLLDDTPDMKATAILERLRPLGYSSGISVLRERVRRLRPRPAREAFLTLDFAPGSAFQVDWADFGFALPGCPRRVSAFVMAACYSRYLYVEFTLSQAMGSFLRCMERALGFFGGVAAADIFDFVALHKIEVLWPTRLRGRGRSARSPARSFAAPQAHNGSEAGEPGDQRLVVPPDGLPGER